MNGALHEDGAGNFWKQGGYLSNFANRIPGMNSLARLHDHYQIEFGNIGGWVRNLFNVPAMIPATLINYVALMDTIPAYSTLYESDLDSSEKNSN